MNLTHSFAVLSDKRRVILGKHQILTYTVHSSIVMKYQKKNPCHCIVDNGDSVTVQKIAHYEVEFIHRSEKKKKIKTKYEVRKKNQIYIYKYIQGKAAKIFSKQQLVFVFCL